MNADVAAFIDSQTLLLLDLADRQPEIALKLNQFLLRQLGPSQLAS